MLLGGFIFLIITTLCSSASLSFLSNFNGSSIDQSSLLSLKAHIQSNTLAKNWTEGTNVCSWIGVSCGRKHPTRVTGLSLSGMGLRGTIAGEIGNLSFLSSLDVSHNSFNGRIPNEIGNLWRLQKLRIQFNHFTGNIPSSIGNLWKLEDLQLSRNQLDGSIPTSIFSCTRIKLLFLSYNNLTGTIPLGNLTQLQVLALGKNQLTGKLPSAVFNISSFQTLDATSNAISGTLSEDICSHPTSNLVEISLGENNIEGGLPLSLTRCSALKNIYLDDNRLFGNIPSEFWNLTSLEVVALESNHGFTGTIPPSIANLSNLQELDLGDNVFRGTIPPEIGLLSSLTWLALGENELTGEIPKSFFNLSTLEFLDLNSNDLSGDILYSIARSWPNLQIILVGNNHLTGNVPDSISNLSGLSRLDLARNSFTGLIPANLGDLAQLELLSLDENHFTNNISIPEQDFLTPLTGCSYLLEIDFSHNPITGELPESIGSGNLSMVLEKLTASSCRIRGTIPDTFGNFSSLYLLDLGNNEITGAIPKALGNLRNLQRLEIASNRLQGLISNQWFCNLEKLYFLNFSSNHLSGQLPRCLGNLSSLTEIFLDNNGFNSSIISTLWHNFNIRILSLSSNSFHGSLSQDIGNAKSLSELYLSRNELLGPIPSTIGELGSLVNITLSNNKFNSSIPESFANLQELQHVDLSHNNLSGEIPKLLEKLPNLDYFNVSFNKLSGEIPDRGQFTNFSAEFFEGNDGLCGASQFKVQACKRNAHRPSSIIRVLKYILPPIVFMIAIVILFLRFCGRKSSSLSPSNLLPLGVVHERISYYEILRATSNLDEANLIGRGSLGLVYKGIISDGITVAIKVFDLHIQGGLKSFDTECQIMREVRHRNLVKNITSCSNLDFKALVMEYMPNGNLDNWLHSPEDHYLNLTQRLGILINVADALEYLHVDHSSPIVHCDLKPSNILLDEDMVAHVGDFGVSKLFTEEQRMLQTKTLGTIGYMAPEYGSTGLVSTMVDVYSFGVLLMETFTGKRPTDEMFFEELTLKRWVSESLPDSVIQVVDTELLNSDKELIGEKQERCIESILELAIVCASDEPEERPSMRDVSIKLKRIDAELR